MKELIVIVALFAIPVVSCGEEKKPADDFAYRILCSPKIQKVDGGIALSPNIDWEQGGSGELRYSACTYYRKKGSSDLTRSFEVHGGGGRSSNTSSTTVELDNIEELLVLITIFDKDKNVLRREWHTSKLDG